MESSMKCTPISVIVPIYNVSAYLRKCLDSLKNQTMQDIQFVLVDDGSTDNSGDIADEFGRKDSRFCVHHIENGGVSAARNYGLDHSDGKYIMFADGDDWVADNFCAIPYKVAEENDADMVAFGWYDAHTETDIVKSKYTFGGVL